MRRKHKIIGIAIAVVLVVVSLGAGGVMAKSSLNPIGEDGVISGAYQKVNGMLRLVNGKEDVRKSEVFVQWSQKGLQGEAGEVGPAGPEGDTGPAGPQGDIGPAGPSGVQGLKTYYEELPIFYGKGITMTRIVHAPSGHLFLTLDCVPSVAPDELILIGSHPAEGGAKWHFELHAEKDGQCILDLVGVVYDDKPSVEPGG